MAVEPCGSAEAHPEGGERCFCRRYAMVFDVILLFSSLVTVSLFKERNGIPQNKARLKIKVKLMLCLHCPGVAVDYTVSDN